MALEESDGDDVRKLSRREVEEKLAALQERKTRYEGYLRQLEEGGESQMSLTDPDARLMKENNGFGVGYNVQTAVDAESHLIAGFVVTNRPTDHGLITEVAVEVKDDMGLETLEATADKGYHDPDDIKACLHAGVVPYCLKGVLTDASVEEVTLRHREQTDAEASRMTLEQMIAKAHEGYFVRDAGRNLVICPQGETLRPKSLKRNGDIRYCNKLACRRCKSKCTTSKFKEADFSKDCLIKKVGGRKEDDRRGDNAPQSKLVTERRAVARFKLHMDERKMDNRKCLSEHPFGTIKRTIGEGFFLLRRMFKTEGEMALYCLAYNMRRAMNMRTMGELVAGMAE